MSFFTLKQGIFRLTIIFLSLSFVPLTTAQVRGTWKSLTSFRSATSLTFQNDSTLWVGTEGGLFRYDLSTNTFRTYTNTEGLEETRVTALYYDPVRSGLWIGYESGVLSFLDIGQEGFSTTFDLARVIEFPSKAIRDFYAQGDTLWVATDFGLSLYTPRRREFRESYTRFAGYPSGTPVRRVVVLGDQIFVATASGTARASLRSLNLLSPSEWTALQGTTNSRGLLGVGDSLFIASASGLGLFYNSQFTSQQSIPLVDVFWDGNALLTLRSNGLYRGTTELIVQDEFSQVRNGRIKHAGTLWLVRGDSTLQQIGLSAPFHSRFFRPNSPLSNRFDRISVDAEGRVWGSSSSESRGAEGFYRFESARNEWTNFDFFQPPLSRPARQFNEVIGLDDKTYVATWGSGLFQFSSRDSVRVFNNLTGDFLGIPADTGFVVIPSLARDRRSPGLWLPNLGARSNPVVYFEDASPRVVRRYGSSGLQAEIPSGATPFMIRVTGDNRKWIILREGTEVGRGLVIFDDRRTPDNLTDDRWIPITTQPNFGALPDAKVNDLAEDLDGSVWLATDRGAASFFSSSDPGSISLSSTDLYPRGSPSVSTVFELRNEALTGIVVDAANRKWFSSPNGVWVLGANGVTIEAQFTRENSPLLSNVIRGIAYDSESGRFYFATDRGLSVFKTSIVRAARTMESLFIFPNPYRLPSASPVTIRGLSGNAGVRIISLSGALVRDLGATPSGAILWDGKDLNGQWVASGVYLAVAVSQDGKQSAAGKIAVIRLR